MYSFKGSCCACFCVCRECYVQLDWTGLRRKFTYCTCSCNVHQINYSTLSIC